MTRNWNASNFHGLLSTIGLGYHMWPQSNRHRSTEHVELGLLAHFGTARSRPPSRCSQTSDGAPFEWLGLTEADVTWIRPVISLLSSINFLARRHGLGNTNMEEASGHDLLRMDAGCLGRDLPHQSQTVHSCSHAREVNASGFRDSMNSDLNRSLHQVIPWLWLTEERCCLWRYFNKQPNLQPALDQRNLKLFETVSHLVVPKTETYLAGFLFDTAADTLRKLFEQSRHVINSYYATACACVKDSHPFVDTG